MIISDATKTAFVHVPKCAGTVIRHQLELADPDSRSLWGVESRAGLGEVDSAHLPLALLRELYPDEFAALLRYEGFAIVRDPYDRFRSSLSQHVKRFKKKRLTHFTEAELIPVIEHVRSVLARSDRILPLEYQHFANQLGFVSLDGDLLVSVYAMEDLSALAGVLSERFGQSISTTVTANKDLAFRNKNFDHKMVWRANDRLKAVLPRGAYQRLKAAVEPVLIRPQTRATRSDGAVGQLVQSVVDEFYSNDVELHADALRRRGRT